MKEVNFSKDINYLKKFNNLSYCVYPFGKWELFLFGDSNTLKMIKIIRNKGEGRVIGMNFPLKKNGLLSDAIKYFDNYFRKKYDNFLNIDLDCYTEKQKRVYKKLITVPPGRTVSYGELSRMAGIKNGPRFVGNTMAGNLFSIIIPCHRVIKASGEMGCYSSGTDIKHFLLNHEGYYTG